MGRSFRSGHYRTRWQGPVQGRRRRKKRPREGVTRAGSEWVVTTAVSLVAGLLVLRIVLVAGLGVVIVLGGAVVFTGARAVFRGGNVAVVAGMMIRRIVLLAAGQEQAEDGGQETRVQGVLGHGVYPSRLEVAHQTTGGSKDYRRAGMPGQARVAALPGTGSGGPSMLGWRKME